MKIIHNVSELPRRADVAFVPTMGALHAGHQSLIRKARTLTSQVVVSIYVNPLQFENAEDLALYPQTPHHDAELASESGATYLWFPTQEDLYPNGIERIYAGEIGEIFEGHSRRGHFDGVVTVVNALFKAVKPHWALFGEKDLQQLFLIKKMAKELHPEIEIISCETIREVNGLALSSRNVRLSPQGRANAQVIARALQLARLSPNITTRRNALYETLKTEPAFTLDYAEIIDGETFTPAIESTVNQRAIIAGWVEGVRLIDTQALNDMYSDKNQLVEVV